jgi:hypothetical protein
MDAPLVGPSTGVENRSSDLDDIGRQAVVAHGVVRDELVNVAVIE